MRVLLLNDGTYRSLESVNFPVEVEAEVDEDVPTCITIVGSELIRIGGNPDDFNPRYHYFFEETEFEPA